MGPYEFQQKEEKANLTWNSNDTVTFMTRQFWFYQGKRKDSLQDRIVTMNPIPLVVSYIVRNWNYYLRKSFSMGFSAFANQFYMTQTVGSLLFDGYPEPWIKVGATLPFLSQYNFPHWDRYAYFYKRNGTTEYNGVLNMGTGKTTKLGEIYYWNYQKKAPHYDDLCGQITGSRQQLFPRNLQKTFLSYFLPDFGRPLKLDFEKIETVNNILGYKFVIGERVLDNGTRYPESQCSCNGECVPSADPYYINLVEGLKPEANKHDSFMIVEPTTGVPLKAHFTLQFNLLVQPVPGVSLFENAPKFFLPVWWAVYSYEVQGLLLFVVKSLLSLHVILKLTGVCMIVVGIFILVTTVSKRITYLRQKYRKLDLIGEQEIVPSLLYTEETI
ncbi:protein peste-like isoform X2 [Zophobas morio]|uniref:protein peste-like isoform X2 n=1 Tax=Zophobas morio TaxID=2755281 RepID=UPI0030836A87